MWHGFVGRKIDGGNRVWNASDGVYGIGPVPEVVSGDVSSTLRLKLKIPPDDG